MIYLKDIEKRLRRLENELKKLKELIKVDVKKAPKASNVIKPQKKEV